MLLGLIGRAYFRPHNQIQPPSAGAPKEFDLSKPNKWSTTAPGDGLVKILRGRPISFLACGTLFRRVSPPTQICLYACRPQAYRVSLGFFPP